MRTFTSCMPMLSPSENIRESQGQAFSNTQHKRLYLETGNQMIACVKRPFNTPVSISYKNSILVRLLPESFSRFFNAKISNSNISIRMASMNDDSKLGDIEPITANVRTNRRGWANVNFDLRKLTLTETLHCNLAVYAQDKTIGMQALVGQQRVTLLPEKENPDLEFTFFDLDKTLYETHFKSLVGLWKTLTRNYQDIPFVFGMDLLAAELSKTKKLAAVSGSPEAFRKCILHLSEHNRIDFSNIRLKKISEHYRKYTKQLEYKIFQILDVMRNLPPATVLDFIGDNAEKDPEVYRLLVALLNKSKSAVDFVESVRVGCKSHINKQLLGKWVAQVLELNLKPGSIIIRVIKDTDEVRVISEIDDKPKITFVRDGLQAACALFSNGRLEKVPLLDILKNLKIRDSERFEQSAQEAVEKGIIDSAEFRAICMEANI